MTGRILLAFAGVLPHFGLLQARVCEQFSAPLTGRDDVCDQHKRVGAGPGHSRHAHQGLACPAGQNDDTAARSHEGVGRLLLVRAKSEAVALGQGDRVRRAVHVTGPVVSGPAHLEQRLLQAASLRAHDHDRALVDARPERGCDRLGAHHLLQHGPVVGPEHQAVYRIHLQGQAAVAGHRLGHVDEQRLGNGVARPVQQRVHDLLGVVASGAGVPERQRGHPVRMHMFRRAF